MRIHVLTPGFTTPNGCAFLMPLLLHGNALCDAGITVRLFDAPGPQITDCDALFLDSKYYSPRWIEESEAILAEIAGFSDALDKVVFFDILDSASWDQARVLPHVTLYCKGQLLRDQNSYLKPLYGYRSFTDYYHRNCGVEDGDPVYSEQVGDPSLLDKLTVSWNSGLADYSWLGPYRMNMYHHLPLRPLLRFSDSFHAPSSARSKETSCRIGTRYLRNTVAYQRVKMAQLLRDRLDTVKLSRRKYLDELQNSKLVISPFGLGEITLRDFEVFMSGALLLKPDMSDVETWPNLFEDGVTMVGHSWDLSDMEEKIETILSDYDSYLEIAVEGQSRYRKYLSGSEAGVLFTEHLNGILKKCTQFAA